METKNYGLLKPAQDDFYDVDVFNANMDKIDNELKKRNTAMENVSDSEVEFVAAEVRENIKSGEALRIIFGKLAKLFADLKKVAFTGNYKDLSDKPSMGNAAAYGVANNDTTTEAGFVADARIVKTHGDEIDVINSNLTANVLHNEGAVNLCNYTAAAPFILPYDGYVGVKCSKGAAQYATLYIETNIADGVIGVRSQGDNSNADFNAIWVKKGMKVYGVVSNTTYGAVTYVPVRSE